MTSTQREYGAEQGRIAAVLPTQRPADDLRRESAAEATAESDDEFGFGRRVSKQDVIYFTSQLAIMAETGIPIATALAGIVEQEENPRMRKTLLEIKEAVESGEDFSAALARYPRLFDKTYVSLVRASEATGSMGPMLDRIAGYLRKEVETVGRVRAAMAYPTVMMILAAGVTAFLLTYILPKFIPLFQQRGSELPRVTRALIDLSQSLADWWYLYLGAMVAVVVAFLLVRRTEAARQHLDWLKLRLPVVGPVFRKVAISRSVRTLGTMIGSGVPMTDAIRLAGEVSGNYHFEQIWREVLDQVVGGKRICEVLTRSPLFPCVLVQMISSGEETGKLDFVLERVSNYYDQEVEMAIKTATSLIEPLMIAVMGIVVGGIGMALLLPIFSLSRPQ